MKICDIREKAKCGGYDRILTEKMGTPEGDVTAAAEKLCALLDSFKEYFGADENREVYLISVGGRSEISGNHTDHNRGRVVAASVNLPVLAVVSKRSDGVIRLKSHGFDEDTVKLSEIGDAKEENFFRSSALIEGTVKGFLNKDFVVGGFDAYTVSDVLRGSGLSSSAAFEVTVGKILSCLYNEDNIPSIELAKIAQFAENVYFGKPCGLMDQAACAVGGLITVDFESTENPKVEKLDFDLSAEGFSLCIVDTGGCHADLNDEYAAVPREMKDVASFFGKSVLREVTEAEVIENLPSLRERFGDRAVLRALHFFGENSRVENIVNACRGKDTKAFLQNITASGKSSYCYLQNVYPPNAPREQGLSLALLLSEKFISEKCPMGACRVHGGGFAGTIQAFIPIKSTAEYKAYMEKFFGEGTCHTLRIRNEGAVTIEG